MSEEVRAVATRNPLGEDLQDAQLGLGPEPLSSHELRVETDWHVLVLGSELPQLFNRNVRIDLHAFDAVNASAQPRRHVDRAEGPFVNEECSRRYASAASGNRGSQGGNPRRSFQFDGVDDELAASEASDRCGGDSTRRATAVVTTIAGSTRALEHRMQHVLRLVVFTVDNTADENGLDAFFNSGRMNVAEASSELHARHSRSRRGHARQGNALSFARTVSFGWWRGYSTPARGSRAMREPSRGSRGQPHGRA